MKSKNQKDFVNITYYLVINRRNKPSISFLKNGGVLKKNSIFIKILGLNSLKNGKYSSVRKNLPLMTKNIYL